MLARRTSSEVKPVCSIYGDYDYANSDKIRQPWAVNLGVRWEWGGTQKEAECAQQPQQPAGKQAAAKMVQQPPVKTTEPWQNTVGGPRMARGDRESWNARRHEPSQHRVQTHFP
jgi:hypothetical protein